MANRINTLVADALKLPRWAVVALAARCARRVLPALFQGETAATNITAIACYAVWTSQEAAGQGEPPPKPPEEVRVSVIMNWRSQTPPGAAIKCASLAYKIARAAGVNVSKDWKSLLTLLPRTARKHPSVVQTVRRDLACLANAARELKWSDETPVPATIFGPMWEEEAPPGWPIDSPSLDPAQWRDWLCGKHPVIPRMDTSWVHTAFAVRCTHRILPLMYQCPEDKLLTQHAEAIWLAAQLAATPDSLELQGAVKNLGKKLGAQMHMLPPGLPNHINHSLGAARMTIWLAAEALQTKPPNHPRTATLTSQFTQAAADSLGVNLEKIEDRDWERILRWAVNNSIEADTGVPQSVFGPLWEKSPPANWPEPAEISLDSYRMISTTTKPPALPEAETLPLWAVTVFCLRVLQRATPWMAHKYPTCIGEPQVKAVQQYLQAFAAVVEEGNPSSDTLDKLLEANRASIASMADELHMSNPGEVVGFGMAIYELDRALHLALGDKNPQQQRLDQALWGLKRFADSLDGTKGILGFSQLTSDELTRLRQRAAAEKWTNQTLVSLSSCGPLWPKGDPKWWLT